MGAVVRGEGGDASEDELMSISDFIRQISISNFIRQRSAGGPHSGAEVHQVI